MSKNKNNVDYYISELNTQIEITKGKIKYAEQAKNFIYMEDMRSLLSTLIGARNTIEYYTKKEHKHLNAFNNLFKTDAEIFEEANKSVYAKIDIDNNDLIQIKIIKEKGKKSKLLRCLKFETPKTR